MSTEIMKDRAKAMLETADEKQIEFIYWFLLQAAESHA